VLLDVKADDGVDRASVVGIEVATVAEIDMVDLSLMIVLWGTGVFANYHFHIATTLWMEGVC
jgi:hypothetical protein